jgi:hypothetical protein
MASQHNVALFPQTDFSRRTDPGGANSHGIDIMASEDPLGGRSFAFSSPSISPCASSSLVMDHSQGKMQPPTPVRRSDNLLLLVGIPPPPPPTMPPPKKSKRAQSAPRTTARHYYSGGGGNGAVPSSSNVTSPVHRSDSIVEERLRAARRMYQSDDLVLMDTFASGNGATDPISESRSMSSTSHPHAASIMVPPSERRWQSTEPSDVADWGSPSNAATPRERMQVLAVVPDDDLEIPPPPPQLHASGSGALLSSSLHATKSPYGGGNSSNGGGAENVESVRIRPFSPNFRSGESLLATSPSAQSRHSPTKSSVHSFAQSKGACSPATQSRGSVTTTSPAASRYRSTTTATTGAFVDQIVESRSSNSSSRSPSPPWRRTQSRHQSRTKTPERSRGGVGGGGKNNPTKKQQRAKTPDRAPPAQAPHSKRDARNSSGGGNGGVTAPILTRLRPKTPERLRLRPKTPERKKQAAATTALDRPTTTDNSTMATTSNTASMAPTSQKPKQGFFRKLFAKKKKKDTTAEAAALSQTRSEDSPKAPSPRTKGVADTSDGRNDPLQQQLDKSSGDHHPLPAGPHLSVDTTAPNHITLHSSQSGGHSQNVAGSLVADHIPTVEEDRPHLFMTQDDVSTLTIPTIDANSLGFGGGHTSFDGSLSVRTHRRKDPSVQSGASSDPMGRYWNAGKSDKETPGGSGSEGGGGGGGGGGLGPTPTIDPFREPFFAEPDGASPAVHNRTAVVANNTVPPPDLKVNVQSALYDPAGASPLQSSRRAPVVSNGGNRVQDPSPRGYQTPVFLEHPTQDPVGESPLHKNDRGPSALVDGSPFAADPPLYLNSADESGLVSEGSSLTSNTTAEKKDHSDRVKSQGHGSMQTSSLIPTSTTIHSRKGRSFIPRSPLQRIESDSSVESQKGTIASYSPRVLPPATKQNVVVELTTSDSADGVQHVPTPRTRNTSLQLSEAEEKKEEPEEELPNSPKKSPSRTALVQKAIECSPRRNWSPRNRLSKSPSSSVSPQEYHAVEIKRRPEQETIEIDSSRELHVLESSAEHSVRDLESISPLASVASTTVSLTSAAKKASKRLTMSNAAKVNARAVAYLHALHHESSPREFWRETESDVGSGASSPLVGSLSSALLFGSVARDRDSETQNSLLFSSYSKGKFKNRKGNGAASGLQASESRTRSEQYTPAEPRSTKGASQVKSLRVADALSVAKYMHPAQKPEVKAAPDKQTRALNFLHFTEAPSISENQRSFVTRGVINQKSYMVNVNDCFSGSMKSTISSLDQHNSTSKSDIRNKSKPLRVDVSVVPNETYTNRSSTKNFAVAKGFEMLREQREHDISVGKVYRVSPLKRSKQPAVADSSSRTVDAEPKDPIQRAGRRLLAKAAVPIQAAARRYLAQQEAVDRMWALLEIQSYVRRWRAEAVLVASIISAVTVQAIVRGFIARCNYRLHHESATLIQKVVRGYMVAAKTYDFVYKIVVTQARARGWITRVRVRQHLAKMQAAADLAASRKLQTWWRCRSSQLLYQFLLFDTIMAQCIVRRFLARRRVTSMQLSRRKEAALKIQTAWRGFKCYSEFIFYLVDCMLIQRTVRTWLAKRETHRRRELRASTRIQALWRCYVRSSSYKEYCAARVIQTKWRGYTECTKYRQNRAARIMQRDLRCFLVCSRYRRNRGATKVQKEWRCFSARTKYKRGRAATTIQREWRCYAAFTEYLFTLADVIRIQQAVRSRFRRRVARAIRLQTFWRSHQASSRYIAYTSARKIQRNWRRTFDYDQYKQSRKSVIMAQSVARQYLARNELSSRRSELAAVIIQKHWRRSIAENSTMYDLACIILVQSVVRRNSARVKATCLRTANVAAKELAAAIKIQAQWRSFWEFSHYLILQYETVRMQALVRGKLFRQDFNLQLGCCIMIQSAVRRFLTTRRLQPEKLACVWTDGRVWETRERLSCTRIQFWWRIVLECQKEKRAALVIERFFMMIKREIDREIERRERKQRRKNKREDDDSLLERAWLKTVDSNTDVFSFESGSDVFDFSPKEGATPRSTLSVIQSLQPTPASRLLSPSSHYPSLLSPKSLAAVRSPPHSANSRVIAPDSGLLSPTVHSRTRTPSTADSNGVASPGKQPQRSDSSGIKDTRPSYPDSSPQKFSGGRNFNHHASSPPKHLIMRHEYDMSPISRAAQPKSTRTHGHRAEENAKTAQKAISRQPDELIENLSLEEAFLDAEIKHAKEKKSRHQEHPRLSLESVQHFFADDLESFDDSCNIVGDAKGLLSAFQKSATEITGPQSSRSDTEQGRSVSRSRRSSTRSLSKSKRDGSSKSKQSGSTRSSRTYESPSRRSGPLVSKPSPRHNKIHVMKAHQDYPKKAPRSSIEKVEDDDEYGMI